MTDKKKKFEEMSVFIKDFDERVSSQWEQWKNELYYKIVNNDEKIFFF